MSLRYCHLRHHDIFHRLVARASLDFRDGIDDVYTFNDLAKNGVFRVEIIVVNEVDEEVVEKFFEVPQFILKCQKVTEKMTKEEIAIIRRELQTEI